jgi:predicted phage baseplate assembly protein
VSLAPLVLDDLDWAQLTESARLRMPAHSAGRWTLHAPVDPGVTLVELFAWLLDQRGYWMDRVPEPLFRAVVTVLGEAMRPVGAAQTVLAFDAAGPVTTIVRGTTLEIASADAGPIFATLEGIELLRVERVCLLVGGASGAPVDREHDLRESRGVELLPADGGPGEAKVVLYLAAPPAPAGRTFSLFVELDAPPSAYPEWSPEAAVAPPAADLTWWYSRGGANPPARFDTAMVRDGTLGLRRSGIMRLPIPVDWAPDGPMVGTLTPYAVYLRTAAATFTYPPILRRLLPNAALAAHRRLVRERWRIVDWLPLPGLELVLDEASGPAIPAQVWLRIRELDGRWHRWRHVADFAQAGPSDRVFRVNRTRRRLEFGDGLTGRIPRPDPTVPAGTTNVTCALQAGAGEPGNVGAGLEWTGVTVATARASSPVGATGGVEAETVDAARSRIAGLLQRVERAVTAQDYVTVTEGTPGVGIARARAAVGFHPRHPCTPVPGAVTVFIVPWAPRADPLAPSEWVGAPMPDPGALVAVRARLERARLVGTEVWVCPPRYRTVRLAVLARGEPIDPTQVHRRLDDALRRFLDPLTGGDELAGWPFGNPLRPSVLMREAVAAFDEGEIESVAVGLDGAAPDEDCDETPLGPHDLPVLADVSVTFAPASRGRPGGLR